MSTLLAGARGAGKHSLDFSVPQQGTVIVLCALTNWRPRDFPGTFRCRS